MIYSYSSGGKPLLPLTLTVGINSITAEALLDSGSDVNVLPLAAGTALGAQWDSRSTTLRLAGALAGTAAMPLLAMACGGFHARSTSLRLVPHGRRAVDP